MSKDLDQEWLPLPSGISSTSHYSFTHDLLRQFDRKRHQILYGEDVLSIDSKSIDNTSPLRPLFMNPVQSSSIMQNNDDLPPNTEESNTSLEEQGRKRRSPAGNLLHKPSYLHHYKTEQPRASLINSWTLKNPKKYDNGNGKNRKDATLITLKQKKIHTTIPVARPIQDPNLPSFQPPVITQYPPKPLKYSPVEPLLPEENHAKSFFFSLLLNRNSFQLRNAQRPNAHGKPLINFESLSKKWNKMRRSFAKK